MPKHKDALPSPESLHSLEAHLAWTLRPVAPPPNLVQRLGQRIRIPERRHLTARLQDWKQLLVVLGSVLSGMALVITLARALYYMIGRRHT